MSRRRALSTLAACLALTALNLSISWRLLKVEYLNQFSSVEGFFISLARYISGHWGDFSWFSLWHCGMPFQDTYVPLLHLVVAATGDLLSVQPAWFPGWKAFVHAQATPVSSAGMGFVVIQPHCQGDCEILLAWTGRGDLPMAAAVSLAALLLLAAMACRRPDPIARTAPNRPKEID